MRVRSCLWSVFVPKLEIVFYMFRRPCFKSLTLRKLKSCSKQQSPKPVLSSARGSTLDFCTQNSQFHALPSTQDGSLQLWSWLHQCAPSACVLVADGCMLLQLGLDAVPGTPSRACWATCHPPPPPPKKKSGRTATACWGVPNAGFFGLKFLCTPYILL